MIHPTAIIYDDVIIEDNVVIGPYCVIGAHPEHKTHKAPTKGVIIRSGSTLFSHVVIGAGTERRTEIGRNCYLQTGAVISHDCVLKECVTMAMKSVLGGHVTVLPYANLGIGACVRQRLVVGPGVMLGMNAVATKNLEPWTTYIGAPARILKQNSVGLSRCGLGDDDIQALALEFFSLCKKVSQP